MGSGRATGTRRSRASGFTLVELLAVIVVLAALSAVTIMAVGGLTDRGEQASCDSDRHVLVTAEETHWARHDRFATEAELVAGGLIATESELHDVTVGASGGTYGVVAVGRCSPASGGGATTVPAPTTTVAPSLGAGGPAGVSVRVVDSAGQPIAGVTASYRQGYWIGLGTTDANGYATANLPTGSYSFAVDYRGHRNTFGPLTVQSGSVILFPTVPVDVTLTGGTGTLAAANVSHRGSGGYWVGDGSTTGAGVRRVELLPGSYDFAVDFKGHRNTLTAVPVTGARTVDFPLTRLTVSLTGGTGTLAAGSVSHRGSGGYWVGDGATSGAGVVAFDVLPGTYEVAVDFRGHRNVQSAVAISGPSSAVAFPLSRVTVSLTGGTGTLAAANVSHRGSGGYWVGDGSTSGAGVVAFDVLPGTYEVAVDFRGHRNVQSAVVIAAPASTVDFPLTRVTVSVTRAGGALAGASVAHRGSGGYWVGDGSTGAGGTVAFDVLPGTYEVRATAGAQTATVTATVPGAVTIAL